ncbi:MAG TPA: hypothetical protein VLV18_03400 [Terriglobales bacterium]|nr:hypothetical protein [Terriglobales bacterium]
MPPVHDFIGLGLFPLILQTAVAIAFIWLAIKLSRVLDAYTSRLTTKT